MLLLDFIRSNSDWEEKLKAKPYCITTKRKDGFVLLSYSQIESDFCNPLVRECRGIILDESSFTPVCVPFFKFGNYGESYVPDIDWSTARVQEKVDGSLIKLWFYAGEWHVSTNGTIDAKDAPITSDTCPFNNFYELFEEASKGVLDYDSLDRDYTFMFELVSPYNRIVVPHTETKIYHIGTRNNKTLEELDVNIGIQKPMSFNLHSLQECIAAANALPFDEEGYVVVDGNWNRVKIKSPAYVAVHHLKNNGAITKAKVVGALKAHEEEEFLNYYPEYKPTFDEMRSAITALIFELEEAIRKADRNVPRKEFAEYAKTTKCPPFMFLWYDNKVTSAHEWLMNQSDEKIVQWTERSD